MNRIRRYFVEILHATAFKPGGDYVVMTQEGFEEMKQWMVDIYRGVKQSEEMGEVVGLEISPALRKVFDGQ